MSSYLVSYLYMNEEAKNLVFPGPIVLFRGARKLSSYLVRIKFYPLHHKIGSKNVLKIVVKFVIMWLILTHLLVMWLKNLLKLKLNCDDRYIIYLLTCKQCQKKYTGETTDDIKYRWNNCKSKSWKFDRKESCMEEYLYINFISPDQRSFLNDVSVTLITKQMDQTLRKGKTTGWRH